MYDYNLIATNEAGKVVSNFNPGAVIALTLVGFLALVVIALILVSNCLIFKKAGEKSWKGLIPLYNSWIETKIAGLGWYWFLIFAGLTALIGSGRNVNYVISVGLLLTTFNYNYNISKKFGKSNGFAFLCTILPIIGLPILAFGSVKYNKDAKVDKNGIFSVEKF